MAAETRTYDFKSIGQTIEEISQERDRNFSEVLQKPIGIKTPLEYDHTGRGLFKMHYNFQDSVADNLRNLILTNHGERVGHYSFGANLRPLIFEVQSGRKDREIGARIMKAVQTYMPYISLTDFTPFVDYLGPDQGRVGRLGIKITYKVEGDPADRGLKITLFTAS